MITVSPKHRVFLAIEAIDFRKGLDAISRLCLHRFHHEPMTGHYFIFRNKRKTDLKMLYYDSQGYCLFHKRLSSGKFSFWPTADVPLVTLTPAQFQVLLYNGNPSHTQEEGAWSDIIST